MPSLGDVFRHASPSQHAVDPHELPSPLQSPATAAGPDLQVGKSAAAAPVQKHDASSNVMHVKARQYGRSALLPGKSLPGSPAGMHTSPIDWQRAAPLHDSASHFSPIPEHSAGGAHAGGALVIAGPV